MKKIFVVILLLLVINSSAAFANTGVFFGAGNQVIPIKNNDIQLVRESVNIKLTIEKVMANSGWLLSHGQM